MEEFCHQKAAWLQAAITSLEADPFTTLPRLSCHLHITPMITKYFQNPLPYSLQWSSNLHQHHAHPYHYSILIGFLSHFLLKSISF